MPRRGPETPLADSSARELAVGRFEYQRELGRGSQGRVWLVRDQERDELLALKLVAASAEEQVRAEFALLARVAHPNLAAVRELVRIHDAPPELRIPRGTLGLLSAYVPGDAADVVVRAASSKPAQLALAVRVLDRAARALSAVHARGFVHGDVKPANLIVSVDGKSVTLIDLGLARPPGFEERPSGTPDFMAPELFRGELTPAADVYALGVTVWRLLSPLRDADNVSRTPGELIARAIADPEQREPLPAWVPAPLRTLLSAMRAPERADRPRSARELLVDLAQLSGALPAELAAEFSDFAHEARTAEERSVAVLALPRVGGESTQRSLIAALESERAVVVLGPPGSGRTRLIRDAVQALQLERARSGRSVPNYRPARSVPLRIEAGPSIWHLAGGDADAVRGEEVERFAAALSLEREPSVLVLERSGSLQNGTTPEIALGPLDSAELTQLLRLALPEASIKPELVTEAAAVSGGLAARLCRLLAAGLLAGAAMTKPGQLRAHAGAAGELPELPDSAQRFVESLSVCGGVLARDQLARRIPAPAQLAEAVRLTCALGLCSRAADGRLALRPDLARSLWDSLAPARRAEIARELASEPGPALGLDSARASEGRSVPDERTLAFLACARGEVAEAQRRFVATVQHARKSGDPALALAHAREAEHVLGEPTTQPAQPDGKPSADRPAAARPEPLSALQLAHVDALRALGRYREALDMLDTLDAHALRLGASGTSEPSALARAELLRLAGDSPAASRVAEALQRSGVSSPPTLRAAGVLVARLALDAGRVDEAERAARAVLDAAGEEPEALRAAEVLALALIARDQPAQARAVIAAALGPARARGDRAAEARLGSVQGMIDRLSGDRRAAARSFSRAFELSDAAGEYHAAASFLVNLATAQLDAGELGTALASLREGVRRLARLGRARDVARTLYNLALARHLIGDSAAALLLAEQAREGARAAGDPGGEAFAGVLRAEIALEQADANSGPERVRAQLATLLADPAQVLERLPASERLAILARAAAVLARSGGEAEAAKLLSAAEREGEAAARTSEVELLLARAAVASVRGEAIAGSAHAERALAAAKERGEFAQLVAALLMAADAAAARSDANLQRARLSELRALLDAAALGLSSADRASLRDVRSYRAALSALPAVASSTSPAAHGGDDPRFRSLTGIAKRLAAETRPRRLYERILDAAIDLTRAESGFLLLRDRSGVARVRAGRGEGERDRELEIELISQSIVSRVMATGQPLATVDAISDARLSGASSVHALALRSVAVVPLRTGRDVFGVIYLDDRLRPFAFGDAELALLSDLADLAAIALEATERLRREGRAIRRLQATRNELARQVEVQAAELAGFQLAKERAGGYAGIVAHSPPMREALELALRVARSDVPVLIRGESGTGKELVARAIHDTSARSGLPFVSENCGAIPETLLESTLFGHVKGAFTGADRRHLGLFEAANGGTLFLDEIGEMNPGMQVRLLRVLQDGEVRPVGGERTIRVNVRVVCATHRDIDAMVEQGAFREDLFYRLAVVALVLPPLRERGEDVVPLIQHFLAKHAPGRTLKLDRRVVERLCASAWPGNVRQLENEVRRALALSSGDVLREEHFAALTPRGTAPEPSDLSLRRQVDDLERKLIKRALAAAKGNQTRASELLGVSRFGLQKMVKRLNL